MKRPRHIVAYDSYGELELMEKNRNEFEKYADYLETLLEKWKNDDYKVGCELDFDKECDCIGCEITEVLYGSKWA